MRLGFLFILLLTTHIAFAQEELILGVSPASKDVCIRPGDWIDMKFLISTSVKIPQSIIIFSKGPNWLFHPNNVTVIETYDLQTRVSVPATAEEGQYKIEMHICREPDEKLNESLLTYSCVIPVIRLNVSNACPIWHVSKTNNKQTLIFALSLLLLVVVALFVYRCFHRR